VTFDQDVPGFPGCKRCRYRQTGPIEQCVTCAHRTLSSPGARSCPICDQVLEARGQCGNRLCHEHWRREFTRVHAIAMKERGSPLERTIIDYKYYARWGWGLIIARLLLGWLERALDPRDVDLIIASPTYTGPPARRFPHTEAVIDSAAVQDVRGLWPFDQEEPRAIVATGPHPQSAGGSLANKQAAAAELAAVLLVPDPARVRGKRVLIYDDILTSGETLNTVAGALRRVGAAEVSGVVLARQAWSS